MDKKTPLYSWHESHHGKMVSFAGYLMPIQYDSGILYEHHLVREKVGLFDVSHMGEFFIEGKDALANINYLISNDFTDLEISKIRYGVLMYEDGNAVDDVLVYRLSSQAYMIVVNASNIEKDADYIKKHLFGEANFSNQSDAYGQVALQGPLAEKVLRKLVADIPEAYYSFINGQIKDMKCILSRTGYTGEDGFELYIQATNTQKLWECLLETGAQEGVEPCGLGARDTLRLEAAMPLYGHELSESISPLEAGLKRFVRLDKEAFIAQAALEKEIKRRRIGLEIIGRKIAREGYSVFYQGQEVGTITSGTHSPTLNKAIALALVDASVFKETEFEVDIRGKRVQAIKVKLPFLKG